MLRIPDTMSNKESVFNIISDIRKSDKAPVHLDNIDLDGLKDLVAYLRISHSHYVEECFPRLHEAVHTMLQDCDAQVSTAMNRFFDEYEKQVFQHFRYEERHLFPEADALIAGRKIDRAKLAANNGCHDHNGMETSLKDMKMLVINHIASSDKLVVLSYLFRLEDDIHKHVIIEDRLFVPLLIKLAGKNE